MDYLFFDYFNKSLWNQIKLEGQDFWDELKFFRAVKQNVSDFCERTLLKFAYQPLGPVAFRYVGGKGQLIRLGSHGLHPSFGSRGRAAFEMGGERSQDFHRFYNRRHNNPYMRFHVDSNDENDYDEFYDNEEFITHIPKDKLRIPNSKWGPGFTFDAVKCMGMYFNPLVFKNLLRVRQHPHLCKALNNIKQPPPPTPDPKKAHLPTRPQRKLRRWWKLNLESFDPKTRRQAVFHPAYCTEPKVTKYGFSKEIVFARNAYGFSYVHKG